MDGDNFLPCQIAARRNHAEVARMLLPSNPITSLFEEGDLSLLGPPTLAAIAGAVLRATLAGDLDQLMQQEQQAQQEEGSSADDSSADGSTEAEDGCAEPCAHAEEACESQTVSPAAAPAPEAEPVAVAAKAAVVPAEAGGDLPYARADSSLSSSSAGDTVCGVCFDLSAEVRLNPCGHQLCLNCCKSLLDLNSRCVMVCPFCRRGVGHLVPVCQPVAPCGVAHAAAAAVPMTPGPAVALTSNHLVL